MTEINLNESQAELMRQDYAMIYVAVATINPIGEEEE